MSENSNKLQEMIDISDTQIESIDSSISQIQSQIDELQSQIDAIRGSMLDPINADMTNTLEAKMIEIGGDTINYPEGFGTSTVSNFQIDSTGTTIYEYYPDQINWDDSTAILDLIQKFNFGYDYIIHPLGVDGTYGLQPKVDQLNNAKTLLTANKTKIQDSKTEFEPFV